MAGLYNPGPQYSGGGKMQIHGNVNKPQNKQDALKMLNSMMNKRVGGAN